MTSTLNALSCLPPHSRIECDFRPLGAHSTGQLPQLILIRGLPGSGKSTLAQALSAASYETFEADMFFMASGTYRYEATRVREAHEWCQRRVRDALGACRQVVVSNTFTRLSELAPYLAMSRDAVVVHTFGAWRNIHGVPPEMAQRMTDRWEPLNTKAVDLLLAGVWPRNSERNLQPSRAAPVEPQATRDRRRRANAASLRQAV